MPFEITMPQLGLTMEKGAVVEWFVREGEPIAAGQEIFSVETDKSVVAVEAPQGGTLARILVPVGQTVPVGTCLAIGTAPGEALPAGWQPGQADERPTPKAQPEPEAAPAAPPVAAAKGTVQASWKARSLARDVGLAKIGRASCRERV